MPPLKRITFNAGDILCLELENGKYSFAKVLLDIKKVNKLKILPEKNPFVGTFWEQCSLIGYYNGLFDSADIETESLKDRDFILTQFCSMKYVKNGVVPILGNSPVAPHEVQFPEAISPVYKAPSFAKGLILASVNRNLNYDKLPTISYANHPRGFATMYFIYNSENLKAMDLENSDLRYHPSRSKILKQAGLSANMSYDDMCRAKNLPTTVELLKELKIPME